MANYNTEKHTQILIALLKFHGVRKVVASPGTTNITFVGSIQSDPWFEIYSAVDERSAAFMANGIAAESGEPVVLSCTGSTASRNYIKGLSEAYEKRLPIIAITATQHLGRVGSGYSQVLDRSRPLINLVRESVVLGAVHSDEDIWACGLLVNKALIALRKNGGGPVHINHVTTYSGDFSVKALPAVKGIAYTEDLLDMPALDSYKRIAILVGQHGKWAARLSEAVEVFCQRYNAVVLHYHASNYKGRFGVNHALIITSQDYVPKNINIDLIIYLGTIPRYISGIRNKKCEIWCVNPEGDVRDRERRTTRVFKLEETAFFEFYNNADNVTGKQDALVDRSLSSQWQAEFDRIIAKVPELPFSNVWLAQHTIDKFPEGCVLHLAGSNTARAWNFFKLPTSVTCFTNEGAMGIDGQLSASIGESLAAPDVIHFCVIGDLTFYYDMNAILSGSIGRNFRLMVINNGLGEEMRLYNHPAYAFGEKGKEFMSAAGHFGNKSPMLTKRYVEDAGFQYLSASNKGEYLERLEAFLSSKLSDKPLFLEVFTEDEDENDAIFQMQHLAAGSKGSFKITARNAIKRVAGDKGLVAVKKLLRR